MNPDAVAVVIGMSIHGLSVARALARNDVPVIALEANADAPALRTRYASVFVIDGVNSDALPDILNQIRPVLPANRPAVLFPTSDNMVRSIGRNWSALEDRYRLSWSGCTEKVLHLLDKSSLAPLCEARNINYPRSFVLEQREQISAAVDSIGFPLLVKPLKPLSGFKAVRVTSAAELETLFDTYKSELPFLVQRWIDGESSDLFFCSMLLQHSRPLCAFTGRKVRSVPAGTGMGTVVEWVDNPEVLRLAHDFIDGLDLSGPIAIEFKRDSGGRYWLIEPNVGRTEYSVDLIVQSGINLPFLEFNLALGKGVPAAPVVSRPVRWFDTERDPLGYARLRVPGLLDPTTKIVTPYAGHGDFAPLRARLESTMRRGWRKLAGTGSQGQPTATEVVIQSAASYEDLPGAAREQLEALETDNLFVGSSWFRNFEHTVARFEGEPCWHSIFARDGRLLGVWPLVRNWPGRGAITAMCNYYTTYISLPWFADAGESSGYFLNALQRILKGADRLELFPVAPDDALFDLLAHSSTPGIGVVVEPVTTNWYQDIPSLDAYSASRPSRLLHTISRKSRRLEREEMTFELIEGTDGLSAALDAYFRIYGNSWKADEPYPQFIVGLAEAAARAGWLRLGIVRLHGTPVAAQLWLVQNNTAYIYKLAHDEEFARFSAGTVLTWLMVEHVINVDAVHRIDYLTGNDDYKKLWMDNARDLYRVVFHNLTDPRGVASYARARLSRLVDPASGTGPQAASTTPASA